MSTPPKPAVAKTKQRTGLAWQEFNSLPVTPPPVTNTRILNPPVMNPPIVRPPAHLKGKWIAVLVAAAAVGLVAGILAFRTGPKPTAPRSPRPPVAPTAVAPVKPAEPPAPQPVAVPSVPAELTAKPHIEIIPQPTEDSSTVEQAPARGARSAQPAVRGRPSIRRPIAIVDDPQPVLEPPRPELKREPRPTAVVPPVEEFGMDLQRPIPRRPIKRIDETDPYIP